VTVAAGLALALAAWTFLFALPRRGLWARTWLAAAVVGGYGAAALAAADRLDGAIGPVTATEGGVGLGAAAAWLVATHVGHAVLCRLFPSFRAQLADLYALRDRTSPASMVGAVVAMGVAEELFFRGFLQDRVGLLLALAAYTAVQVVERKWALVLAALLGGAVWGGLAGWRNGLVAPVVAHVLWTGVLTFVWPLNAPPAAPAADPPDPSPTARPPGQEVP
jgi:membrane protease YdiL (CAAX protease family)